MSSEWTRREILRAIAASSAGAALGALWSTDSSAEGTLATPVVAARAKLASEAELDAYATSHPILHGVLAEALAQTKYSFAAAAAGHPVTANDLAATSKEFLGTRPAKSKTKYTTKATAMLAAPQATRDQHFGRFSTIAPATFATMDRASALKAAKPRPMLVMQAVAPAAVNLANDADLRDALADAAEKAAQEAKADTAAAEDLAKGREYQYLAFIVKEVRCLRSTDDRWGADEIALAGSALGATGVFHEIPQFRVKDDMEPGGDAAVRTYKGYGKQFFKFNVVRPAKPSAADVAQAKKSNIKLDPDVASAVYTVGAVMAEVDGGSFGKFLQKLWSKIGGIVSAALAEVAGTAVGATALSFIPGIGTAIGAVIGAFIGWIVSLFDDPDDIMGSKTRTLTLHHQTLSAYKSFGLIAGRDFTMDFTDVGHYRVKGIWKLQKT